MGTSAQIGFPEGSGGIESITSYLEGLKVGLPGFRTHWALEVLYMEGFEHAGCHAHSIPHRINAISPKIQSFDEQDATLLLGMPSELTSKMKLCA